MSRPSSSAGFTALVLGMALTIIDVPMMAIAMPGIGAGLALSTPQMGLVTGVYPLVYAMFLMPAGRAGDMFGRRRVFLAGGALFVTGALLSALAGGLWGLAAARVLQGLGAAALAPQAMAMIPQLFPPAGRTKAFARYAMTVSLSSVSGPLVAGGLLILAPDRIGWRAVFLLEVGLGLIVMSLARQRLPRDQVTAAPSVGLAEIMALAGVIACLILPLSVGPVTGWTPLVFLLMACAVPLWLALRRIGHAQGRAGKGVMLPAELVGSRQFLWGLALILLAVSAAPGFFVVLSLALQEGLGLTAFQTGLVTAGFPVGVVAGSWLSGRLVRLPLMMRVTMGAGLLCAAFLLLQQILPHAAPDRLMPLRLAMLAAGLAMGLTVTAVFQNSMSGLPAHLAGAGAGAAQTVQQIGMAASIAVSFALFWHFLGDAPATGAVALMLRLQVGLTALAAILALSHSRRQPRDAPA